MQLTRQVWDALVALGHSHVANAPAHVPGLVLWHGGHLPLPELVLRHAAQLPELMLRHGGPCRPADLLNDNPYNAMENGCDFLRNHSSPHIDFTTIHCW